MGTKTLKIKSEAVNLEKEIERYLLGNADFLIKEGSKNVVQAIAHYFYDLGCRRTAEKYDELEYNRQRAEESVPADLEEAAWEYAPDLPSYNIGGGYLPPQSRNDLRTAFKDGAEWQKEQDEKEQADLFTIVALDAAQMAKEQMMKGAVEGLFQNTPFPTICLDDCKDYNFKDNQRVRIIIVKED